MTDTKQPGKEVNDTTEGVTRREFCLKSAAVVGAAAVTLYVPPRLTPVALPAAFAKAAPANKESCEKDPVADKDPNEKDPSADKTDEKDPGEKDPRSDKTDEKDPNADKDPFEKDPASDKSGEGAALGPVTPPSFAGQKDEWV
jgi:hypothetical protein